MVLNRISCNNCQSSSCFLKQNSSSIDQDLIESKKNQTIYSQGQNIIQEGNPILGLYFIQQGKAKIFTTGMNGTQQIVRLVRDGESLCFRGFGRTTYLTSTDALEECRVCFLESKDFMEVCNISQLSMHIINYLSNELDNAEKRLKYLMQMNVREKTAEALLFMKSSFGVNEKDELDVYMSRKDVAAIAGTSEEIIIRQLSDFEKEKLIERRDHGSKIALLDEKKLVRLISKYNISA